MVLPQEETLVAKKKKLKWVKRRNLGGRQLNWVIFSMSEFGKVMTGAGEVQVKQETVSEQAQGEDFSCKV